MAINFWQDKLSCWEMLGCPEEVSSDCIARLNQDKACWNHLGTQVKKTLDFPIECKDCKVFKMYGGRDEPPECDARSLRGIAGSRGSS
jgi:hypothetical protein